MTARLTGAVSMVTGAASGIGRATAAALSAEGSTVALVDVAPAVVEIASAMGDRSIAIEMDISRLDELPGLVQRVLDSLGRIDHLANCAGVTGPPMSVLDVDLAEWDRVYRINVTAPLVLAGHVARHMIERGEGGRIVNVTSSSAFRARMSQVAYGSSKAALAQLTRSLAAELGPHGINVNSVAPGLTRTAITAPMGDERLDELVAGDGPLGNLLRRVAEPEDVAAAIVFLCRPESRQITGQTIHTSAGAIV